MEEKPNISLPSKPVTSRAGQRWIRGTTLLFIGGLLWLLGHSFRSSLLSKIGTTLLPRDNWLFILANLAIAFGMITTAGASVYIVIRLFKLMRPTGRWFQFNVRTLFVLITLVAVPLGWVSYQRNWIRQRRAVILNAFWEQEYQPNGGPPQPPGYLWIFDAKGYSRIWLFAPTPTQLEEAQRLFPEASIEKAVPIDPSDPIP